MCLIRNKNIRNCAIAGTRGFVFLICSSISFALQAANYYIASNGNDAANGQSWASAWKTPGRISYQSFVAGDSIIFRGGDTFYGSIYIDKNSSGSTSKPLVFCSSNNKSATIISNTANGFYAYNADCFVAQNLSFKGSGYLTNKAHGVFIYCDEPGNKKLQNIVLKSLQTEGYYEAGIRILSWPTDGSRSGYENIEINSCTALNNGHIGIVIGGYISTTDTEYSHKNVRIVNCIAHHNDGIMNWKSHSGSGILAGQCYNVIMQKCEAYENGKNNTFADAGPAGIWIWDSKNALIEKCYAHHNRTTTRDGGGFDLDGGVVNGIMQYNYSHDNDGPGFLVAQYTGARKMNNLAVRYNISERDGRGLGILIWSGDPAYSATAKNIDVYNNTVFTDSLKQPFANGAICVYNNPGAIEKVRIANNIFIAAGLSQLMDLTECNGLKFYNNAYYTLGTPFKIKDKGVYYNTLTAWKNASGQEKSTGITLNPRLYNAGNQGNSATDSLTYIKAYKLQPTSPLIGKGIKMDSLNFASQPHTDFFGDSIRNNMTRNIGAHQVQLPAARFAVSSSNLCLGDTLHAFWKGKNAQNITWKFNNISFKNLTEIHTKTTDTGSFTLYCIAENNQSYTDTFSQIISVKPRPIANFTITTGCSSKPLKINNYSLFASEYKWQLDTFAASSLTPEFTLFNPGNYTLKLTAGNGSCSTQKDSNFIVLAQPIAKKLNNHSICEGDSVVFKNQSIHNTSTQWLTNTGINENTYDLKTIFKTSGTIKLVLAISNLNLCFDTLTDSLNINPVPFTKASLDSSCKGSPLKLNLIQSNSNTYNFFARYNEQSTFKEISDIQSYLTADTGNFELKFVVKTQYGCSYSDTLRAYIDKLPDANFSYLRTAPGKYLLNATEKNADHYRWTVKNKIINSGNSSQLQLDSVGSDSLQITLYITKNNCVNTYTQYLKTETELSGIVHNYKTPFSVYPNPAQGNIYVKLNSQSAQIAFCLTDQTGKKIICNSEYNKTLIKINLNTLQQGLYFLNITANEQTTCFRFIKQ